ncbi:hypothetical protein PVAND_016042 [Polypedilum vanderplanki]|uniref:C2H2-type domain-containing protein n=1 Tax=Polypedilum vanderplanki TaxID=319348 RepID=A0A9J6BEP4_POLVA|nr:hypothetical protein PVAND_016042 [Polypedilum vanderplanki]
MDFTSSNLDVSFDLNTLPTDQIFNSTFNYNDSTFTIFASIAPSELESMNFMTTSEIPIQEQTKIIEPIATQSYNSSATLSASENGESAAMINIEDLVFMDTDDLIVEEQFGENGEITEIPISQHTFVLSQPKPQQEPKIEEDTHNMSIIGQIVRCNTCSLDLPSMAYFKRHVTTKKHERARRMELRGRKVNQKKRYVRKCNRFNFQTPSPVPNDFSNDETECLQILDEQLSNSGLTMKNFYETFNFNDEMNVENQIEVLDTLVQSSEEISINQSQQFEVIDENTKPIILSVEDLGSIQNERFLNFSDMNFDLQPQSTQQIFVEPIEVLQVQEKKPLKPAFQNLQQILKQKIVNKPKPVIISDPAPQHHCIPCNKFFAKQCHFTQHNNIVHSGERRYKCNKCGKKYKTVEEHDMHFVKHTENKPNKCELCEKSYINKIDLRRHEKTHELYKPHRCQICDRGFVRYDHLKKHYDVHRKRQAQKSGKRF